MGQVDQHGSDSSAIALGVGERGEEGQNYTVKRITPAFSKFQAR